VVELTRLPLDAAPDGGKQLALDLRYKLGILAGTKMFAEVRELLANMKQHIAPDKTIFNKKTGATVNQLPKAGPNRKQTPSHSSL
jgi:hypothetical protein